MNRKINLILLLVSLLLINCSTVNKVVLNREVETPEGKMLLGHQSLNQFSMEPYSEWYNTEKTDYTLDEPTIAELKKRKFFSYNIIVFLGTWCSDSHREFPRLIKTLQAIGFPENRLTIIALNRKKESPSGEEGLHNIRKVPTIIVKKYENEIGRIVEMPRTGSVEKDLLEIFKRDNFKLKDVF